jgi:hypothetical protein
MMGAFLDNVENHIKTKLGVSKESYKSTLENPLHGPGQGSKPGPDLWKYVSSILMDVLDEVNPGLEYTDPEQKCTSKRPIDGFVDDATVWAAKFLLELIMFTRDKYNEDLAMTVLKELVTETERLAQHWEELLWTSGGKLNLLKCFYYIISWWFDPAGKPHMRTEKELQELGIAMELRQSENGEVCNIIHKDCREAHKTLGPLICPDNKNTEEFGRLLIKGNKMARNVTGSKLYKHDAFVLYRSIWIPSMVYSLPAVYLTRVQLEKVEAKMITAILPKMGYNRHLERRVVFGPLRIRRHGHDGAVYRKRRTESHDGNKTFQDGQRTSGQRIANNLRMEPSDSRNHEVAV